MEKAQQRMVSLELWHVHLLLIDKHSGQRGAGSHQVSLHQITPKTYAHSIDAPTFPRSRTRKLIFIMEAADTFTLLPLQMDEATGVSATGPANNALNTELAALNALHHALLHVETPTGTPPPPVPVNPKRSAQIGKLRESGNAEFRKGNPAAAVKLYTLAVDMALQRPHWEPSGLVREEVSGLLSNRAQANMAQQNWAEGSVDAEASVEMKKVGNAKAWWRRGKCLLEMGRLEEAEQWVKQALEFEATEQDLVQLKGQIESRKAGLISAV
jgi:translocation protein SEC72